MPVTAIRHTLVKMKTRPGLKLLFHPLLGMAFVAMAPMASSWAGTLKEQVRPVETRYKTPEDMLNMIPIIGQIPRSFLWGDGYLVKLHGDELRIDHMGYRSHAKSKNKLCSVSLNYATPVAFFGSRIELPLLEAGSLPLREWAVSSLGDYVVHLSKNAPEHPSISLVATARF
jgi:hypothetical protein